MACYPIGWDLYLYSLKDLIMKRYFFILVLIFLTTPCFATTIALYRISSGEVYLIGEDEPFIEQGGVFFQTTPVATYPDGKVCKPRRILGTAKILDGTVVRNATQAEIDTFAQLASDDNRSVEAMGALEYFKNDPKFRRVITAFASILVDEINILRNAHGLPERTLSQLKTAIENRINKND